MNLRILPSALKVVTRGEMFYARLDQSLGDYFLSSIFGDVDSLALDAGIHREVFGYHRLLAKRFPFAIYYRIDGDTCIVWRVLDCRQNPLKVTRALELIDR
jgi:hypothetical protein